MEVNVYKDLNDRGIFRFYDGTIIYVEEIQYSADGLTGWENTFNPSTHLSTLDNITYVPGHKYRRTRNAGETKWGIPAYWVPEDGQSVILRTNEDFLQWKWELAPIEDWKDLYDLSTLKGDTGDKGDMGEGLAINAAGALDVRPSCCGTTTVTTCNTCNPRSVSTTPTTYLSIGNHRLNTLDVGTWANMDGGTTWKEITLDDVDKYVSAWQASANNNSANDALTCDARGGIVTLTGATPTVDSVGKLYICADLRWTELLDINLPTGLVKVSDGDSLDFLEEKLDDSTIESYQATTSIWASKIRVKASGITENEIASTALADGIDGGDDVKLFIVPADFIGFGLRTYTSDTDGNEDIQVYVQDFAGDGLKEHTTLGGTIDGEVNEDLIVNVEDFITPTTTVQTGLQTSTQAGVTETDIYENIYIKPGDAILIDIDGVNVKSDEKTIATLNETEARVWETDSNTKGIQAKHLHANTVNTNKGLKKFDSTNGSLEVKPDLTRGSIGFNGSGEVEVPDNGIQGLHLNDNTCDNTKGVEISNDKIVVKVDDTSIKFNGSGELEVDEDWVNDLIDNGVGSISVTGNPNMVGDIVFSAISSDNLVSLTIGGAGNPDGIISFTVDTDEVNLAAFINDLIDLAVNQDTLYADMKNIIKAGTGITIDFNDTTKEITINSTVTTPAAGSIATLNGSKVDGTSTSYARADHKHDFADGALTIAKTTGLQTALDERTLLNTWYGNTMISDGNGSVSAPGLIVQSNGNKHYKLIVDDSGNLDTSLV